MHGWMYGCICENVRRIDGKLLPHYFVGEHMYVCMCVSLSLCVYIDKLYLYTDVCMCICKDISAAACCVKLSTTKKNARSNLIFLI
jgi:hypothetical protein